MVERLPAAYREAVLLTEYEGLTQQELAEHADLSLSGAKSRVQRARKHLKEQLLACCEVQLDWAGHLVDYQPRSGSCAASTGPSSSAGASGCTTP
jgi:RNA polymerase sigma-70 factor (ECF subfamily)